MQTRIVGVAVVVVMVVMVVVVVVDDDDGDDGVRRRWRWLETSGVSRLLEPRGGERVRQKARWVLVLGRVSPPRKSTSGSVTQTASCVRGGGSQGGIADNSREKSTLEQASSFFSFFFSFFPRS